MNQNKYAPIAIFTYNRPSHTYRLLSSLYRNHEFKKSPVYIFCDAPKLAEHKELVEETRKIIDKFAPENAIILHRQNNLGLAKSIIDGVTDLTQRYGKVIVFEDDLIVSQYTLDYLNSALVKYSNEDNVMHISAYMYPVKKNLPETFFYREATCWGWATWERAWKYFIPDANILANEISDNEKIGEFNVNNSMYFYDMLCLQRDGQLDSWAICWYASIFRKNGLSLHPAKSFVQNSGFDGTGIHCNIDNRFDVDLRNSPVKNYTDSICESHIALQSMIQYRKSTSGLLNRIKNRFKQYIHKFI